MRNIINLSQVLYSIFLQEQNGIVFQTYFQLAFCTYFAKSQILQNDSGEHPHSPVCAPTKINKTADKGGLLLVFAVFSNNLKDKTILVRFFFTYLQIHLILFASFNPLFQQYLP